MRAVQQGQQVAGGGAERARGVVAAGLVPAIGDEPGNGHHVVAVAVKRAVVAGQDEPPGARAASGSLLVAVAAYAEGVENRLNVARVVNHVGHVGNRLDATWRAAQSGELHVRGAGRLGALTKVTPNTGVPERSNRLDWRGRRPRAGCRSASFRGPSRRGAGSRACRSAGALARASLPATHKASRA